jgi:hypothetical protein
MTALALTVPDPLGAELNESDSVYFELGAEIITLPGCQVVYMPELTSVPAACVVHRVNPTLIRQDPFGWLALVESQLRALGVRLARIYLEQPSMLLENAFRATGYRSRVECGYVLPAAAPSRNDVALRPILSDDDWALKRYVHEAARRGGDGYETDPEKWLELVRRKAATGRKVCFLVERSGQLCGTVAAIDMPLIVRLKNLVVLPEVRRTGIGTAALELLAFRALNLRKRAVGAFGISSEAGDAMYRMARCREVSLIVEWSRVLQGE